MIRGYTGDRRPDEIQENPEQRSRQQPGHGEKRAVQLRRDIRQKVVHQIKKGTDQGNDEFLRGFGLFLQVAPHQESRNDEQIKDDQKDFD